MAGGDCHVGLTYGKPLITKIGGRWVALLTSGYNNNNSTAQSGDNQGYLYVIDVISGKLKHKLGLGVGDANSPAGFTHINAYVDNFLLDNTALRIYGGDLLGNLWRIDVQKYIDEDNDISTPPVYHDLYPTLVSTFKDGAGTPQPITTRPQLMDVGAANAKMVFVGTGRYLGDADVTGAGATQTQSVYAIVDNIAKWTGPLFPTTTDPATTLRQQLHQATLSPNVGNTQRSVVCLTCKFGEGWFVDLPESGERINVEMRLALGTLQFPSNVPNVLGCDTGGSSWMNSLNAASGLEVAGSTQPVSLRNQGRFIVGVSYLRFGGRIVAVTTYSDGLPPTVQVVPVAQTSPLGRPVGWRDLLIR
jgi:type IV pilus assembly protein PilY1